MNTIYFVEGGMKRILSLLMVGIVIFLSSGANAQTDSDGDGLLEIYYIEDLNSIRNNLGAGYELMKSLDFNSTSSYRSGSINTSYTTGSGWDPIGGFNAIFEGNGYTIDNLFINKLSTSSIGLFGETGSNSRIRNIGMTNVSVSGYNYIGALVGNNSGTIIQSYATGNVSGYQFVGGLVGDNVFGTITESYATVSVSGSQQVGGLSGGNKGTITESYATGNVTSAITVGGLVGYNSSGGTITQSYATGNVTGSSSSAYVTSGGLVGGNYGTITYCYWNKNAIHTVGGVIRSNSDKRAIGDGSGSFAFVKGLTLSALKSSTATASDSIRELGPRFIYKQGQLPKIKSIIFSALGTKIYGDAPFVLEVTPSGLTVSFSASNNLVGISNNTVTIKGIGTVSITAFTTGKTDSVVQILTINKANQSIIFRTLVRKTFGDASFVLEATSSMGFTVSFSASSTLVSVKNNTITINGAGAVNITAYQIGNDTYLPSSATQILKIYKANQSISFGTLAQKTIGDAPFVLSASSSAGHTVFFSASNALVSISNDMATINEVGTVSITAYQTGNANYLPVSATQILTIRESNSISKITPTITFIDVPNLTVGQRYILLSDSNSPSDITFTSSDNNKLSIVGNVATAKAKGNVTITAHQAGNVQYNSATLTQSLTVVDLALRVATISFAAIPNLTIGQRYALVANSDSPVDITFTSSDERIATINGNTLTALAKGNVTITASQEGNKEYNAAVSDQNTTVLYLVSLIDFTAIPNLTTGQRYTLLATSNSPVDITFTSSDNDKLSIVRGIAIAKAKGNVTITANQAENAQYNDAVSVQNITVLDPDLQLATINFTAIPNLIIGQKYTLVVSSNSPVPILFISSNSQVATLRGNTLTAVGTGTAVITAIQSGNAEFNATTAQKTVIVNKTGTTPALTFIETPNNSIRIFPNPANDYITIQYDKTQNVSSVKIYDMTGKSYELKMNHDVLGTKADVKNLPKGEYILVIYGERGEVLKTELLVISF